MDTTIILEIFAISLMSNWRQESLLIYITSCSNSQHMCGQPVPMAIPNLI